MKTQNYKYTNNLINESSPYLLQHAHNPVNWYPWGEEALKKAEQENKLLLISIGYAACHWCHVMEEQSFENEQIAEIMNKYYVCIKVDREERPDIDQIYMNAVQIITGRGGWPLNCFALPNGKPFYGGTYFQANQWIQVLQGLQNTFESDKEKIIKAADEIAKGIEQSDIIDIKTDSSEFIKSDLDKSIIQWQKHFDNEDGGNKGAPKFPMPNSLEFLLNYYYYSNDEKIKNHVFLTLNKMAEGGIYDQIDGGFARYSTDNKWFAPHFEKMLYDNGQLISLYSMAYKISKNEKYKRIVYQTIDFIERELSANDGGFYSSLDADSQGEEGKFYVWTKKEIETVLKEDSELFCEYYKVKENGNWENGNNILHISEKTETILKKHHLTKEEFDKKTDILNSKLLTYRNKRIKPELDDKILTSWNAIMLKGFIDAYNTFNEEKFLRRAIQNADFIIKNMLKDDFRLDRNYKNQNSNINAFLDDYASVISSFLKLYQANFDEKYLILAENITKYTIEHFFDNKSGMFFYTSDIDKALISRKMDISDNVIPASNSEMAKNLFYLGKIFYNDDYLKKSEQMLFNVKSSIYENPNYFSNWAILLSHYIYPVNEIALIGENAQNFRTELSSYFYPNTIIAGSIHKSEIPLLKDRFVENETKIYVCKDKVCKLPVDNVNDALILIKQ
ncbi:MAG: thioredoxin domain-containing protein [Bacteroidales bacterium]|nr:thioredoxin domain-containing protein [Bacteroidales bacterium]MBN2756294.1 thioredoxin domain-containing protein [Bacteroidales bacterium]